MKALQRERIVWQKLNNISVLNKTTSADSGDDGGVKNDLASTCAGSPGPCLAATETIAKQLEPLLGHREHDTR